MIDVGKDPEEPIRWVQGMRDNFAAVLFFVSLDDFDVPSSTGEGTKLDESLRLWEDVCPNSHVDGPGYQILTLFAFRF